jgi:hypothetical protein
MRAASLPGYPGCLIGTDSSLAALDSQPSAVMISRADHRVDVAEHAVLADEGLPEVRLQKNTEEHVLCVLFEVAKVEHGLWSDGVFRKRARAAKRSLL